MATYAVGDIQGCLPDLKALLKHVNFGPDDTLWCAGDLVNRGPESLKTLRYIKALDTRAQIVLGNHDLHLIACWLGFRKPNRKDTFDEILRAKDADELLYWLLQQPLVHHDAKLGYTMVHAGIPPQWSLKKALSLAAEVEHMLQSKQAYKFFAHMYGNSPAVWSDRLVGSERLRTITNYFTRMRFCSSDGHLEFESKCNPDSPPAGFKPWYSFPQHKCRKQRIIFGHWAAMMGNTGVDNFIGLDTGCVWGGQLTVLRLDDGQLFSIDCDDCGF